MIDDRKMIGMVGEVDTPGENVKPSTEEEIKLLEEEFKSSGSNSRSLMKEHIWNLKFALKKRANRLVEGSYQISTTYCWAFRRHPRPRTGHRPVSNGCSIQVALNQRLTPDVLKPGVRVALNQDTLLVKLTRCLGSNGKRCRNG